MRVAIGDLAPMVGVRAACEAFDYPRASFYRKGFGVVSPAAAAVRHVPRALVSAERNAVLRVFMRRGSKQRAGRDLRHASR